jgi:hypothetical protein
LGLNDARPATPTTSIATMDPEGDDGPAGFAPLELADGPQPQEPRPNANATTLTAVEHVRTVAVLSFVDGPRSVSAGRASFYRQRRRPIYSGGGMTTGDPSSGTSVIAIG